MDAPADRTPDALDAALSRLTMVAPAAAPEFRARVLARIDGAAERNQPVLPWKLAWRVSLALAIPGLLVMAVFLGREDSLPPGTTTASRASDIPRTHEAAALRIDPKTPDAVLAESRGEQQKVGPQRRTELVAGDDDVLGEGPLPIERVHLERIVIPRIAVEQVDEAEELWPLAPPSPLRIEPIQPAQINEP